MAGETVKNVVSKRLLLSKENFRDDEAIAAFVELLYKEARRYKWVFERAWFTNINFYLGRQYVIPNRSTRTFDQPVDPPHRVRYVVNKIKPFVTVKISKLTRQEPFPEVMPATSDFDDIQKARLANSLIEYLSAQMKIQTALVNEFLPWVTLCGTGFLRPFWNADKGKPIKFRKSEVGDDATFEEIKSRFQGAKPVEDYSAEEPKKIDAPEEDDADAEEDAKGDKDGDKAQTGSASDGGQLQGMPADEGADEDPDEEVDATEGEIDFCVVSPFSVFFHPCAKKVEDSLWALESNVKDLDTLREQWGDAVDAVSIDGSEEWRDFEQRLGGLDFLRQDGEGGPNNIRGDFPKAVEHQLWVRPCRVFPRGKYIVVCGKKVMHNGDFPFDHGRLPYIQVVDNPAPGRIWGQSTVDDLVPIQKGINAKKSRQQEIFNLHAKPRIMNPKGSGVGDDDFTNSPGEVIQYNPNAKPTYESPPPLPEWVIALVAADESDFEDVGGQREATKGQAPGRVDSASGIVALQDADDTKLGPLQRHLGEQLAEFWSQILSLAHQFYKEPRLIRIAGHSNVMQVKEFTGKDLEPKGGFNGRFDVRVRMGSGLSLSRTARMSYVLECVKAQVLNPQDPGDKDMISKILELGGPRDSIFQRIENVRAQAHIENAEMAAGQGHIPNTWDDNAQHILVHEEYRRRPEFLEIQHAKPEVAQLFENHVRMHEAAQALLAKAQAAQAPPGQPAAPPTPPMAPMQG